MFITTSSKFAVSNFSITMKVNNYLPNINFDERTIVKTRKRQYSLYLKICLQCL